jgi:hypothetical protein
MSVPGVGKQGGVMARHVEPAPYRESAQSRAPPTGLFAEKIIRSARLIFVM